MQNSDLNNQKLEKKECRLKKELEEKIMSYVIAAFGLVAGLAWNDAIKTLIEVVFPTKGNNLIAKFSYAILFTIILVIVTVYLGKIFKKEK